MIVEMIRTLKFKQSKRHQSTAVGSRRQLAGTLKFKQFDGRGTREMGVLWSD